VRFEHERRVATARDELAVAGALGVVVVELDDLLASDLLSAGVRETGVEPAAHVREIVPRWELEAFVVLVESRSTVRSRAFADRLGAGRSERLLRIAARFTSSPRTSGPTTK
jgi:hypothetical protein